MTDIDIILQPTGPAFDTERTRIDRLARFLVLAIEGPESGFRKYGLLGRMTRIGLQLGWTTEHSHAEIWLRYENYRGLFNSHPEMFLETAARLRAEYGDALLQRWGVLSPRP